LVFSAWNWQQKSDGMTQLRPNSASAKDRCWDLSATAAAKPWVSWDTPENGRIYHCELAISIHVNRDNVGQWVGPLNIWNYIG
jgi:hypothetical protein